MTVYTLLSGITAVQTLPVPVEGVAKGSNLPPQSQIADLSSGGALSNLSPPANQSFQVNVIGASPGVTVSGTVQLLVSNDGIHWMGYGAAIAVASGPSPGMGQLAQANSTFAFYSAYVQAISGTGAKITCLMNA